MYKITLKLRVDKFLKLLEPSPNCRLQKGDVKEVPYVGLKIVD